MEGSVKYSFRWAPALLSCRNGASMCAPSTRAPAGSGRSITALIPRTARSVSSGSALIVVGQKAATPSLNSSLLMARTAASPCMVSCPPKA